MIVERLLGMDLHIGSEHGFKFCVANSLREFCVCVKEKRETGREGEGQMLYRWHATLLFSVLNNHDPELMGSGFKKMRVCMNCG